MEAELFWDETKNELLKAECGLCFEMVAEASIEGKIVDDFQHPSAARSHQRIIVIDVGGYKVAVPYVTDGKTKFLKTMYFNRDLDKKYGV
jgi:hypothetical protein